MEKVVIVGMGVEGGGETVYGRKSNGVWSFWQEGSSMYLDDNDDEAWRSWTADPVPELSLALPEEWFMMYPTEVHPDFVPQLRREYERCCGDQPSNRRAGRWKQERWQELLSGSGQDAEPGAIADRPRD